MAATSPTRIDEDLFDSAKTVGAMMSRSASQQIVHWARIGRELETSSSVGHRDIARVLAGEHSYDNLTIQQQAVVRTEWAERIAARRDALDLAAEFSGAGRPYVELDDDGKVVRAQPRSRRRKTVS